MFIAASSEIASGGSEVAFPKQLRSTQNMQKPSFLAWHVASSENQPSFRTTRRISCGLGCNRITVQLLSLSPPASCTSLEMLIMTTFPNKLPVHSECILRRPQPKTKVNFAFVDSLSQTDTLRSHILSCQPREHQGCFIIFTGMYLSSL